MGSSEGGFCAAAIEDMAQHIALHVTERRFVNGQLTVLSRRACDEFQHVHARLGIGGHLARRRCGFASKLLV